MKAGWLFLILTNALPVGFGTVLPAGRRAHALILPEVYLNGAGPMRMLIDTANASSIVRPAVAKRLGLIPAGKVEQMTPAGSRWVPVAVLRDVRTGAISDPGVEVMIVEPPLPGLDGVLGQSWLVRHDYLLDYRAKRLVLDHPPPGDGIRLPLGSTWGVPEIVAGIDGRRRALAVDSGAPELVLFETAPVIGNALLESGAGSTPAEVGSASVSLGGSAPRRMTAVRIQAPASGRGLLPACAFDSVYVSNRDGFVVFTGGGHGRPVF